MASNVSVFPEGWSKTGQKVPVDQYALDLRIVWTDDEGIGHEWEGEIKFPNILADVPTPWLKEMLFDLTVKAVKKKLGAYQGDEP